MAEGSTPPRDRGRPRRREHLAGALFVGPAALLLGLFSLFPVGYAVYVSLHRWKTVRVGFVGLENYRRALLADPEFGKALLVTVYYVLGTVPVSIGLGLVLASLLMRRMRLPGALRRLVPWVAGLAAAGAWLSGFDWLGQWLGHGHALWAGVLAVLAVGLLLGAWLTRRVPWAGLRWVPLLLCGVPLALAVASLALHGLGATWLVLWAVLLGGLFASVEAAFVLGRWVAARLELRSVYRTVYFLPYVTSVVAAAAVWLWIFYPHPAESGLMNTVFRWLGLPPQRWVEESRGVFELLGGAVGLRVPGWAAGPSLALVCVMAFSVWTSLGFNIVVLLAALTNVPKEIYEAAAIDGAAGWRRLRHVTVPLISPTLFFLLIVSTIRAFRVFSHVYVMASKDPKHTAHNVTMYIFRLVYTKSRLGYGSAVALLLFALILVVTLVQMRVLGRRVHY